VKLRVRCPAKVNLHLEVLGRRADGYHELRTAFAAAGVWDELWLEEAPDGVLELSVEPPGAVPGGDENLVVRAARALGRRLGAARGARMSLRKGIPVAGGLGGGSSDAAAALVGLTRLWGVREEGDELDRLGARLGADVPFFLVGGVAWGVGRGSEVTPLPDLPAWWLILLPGSEPIPTAEVYRLWDAGRASASVASRASSHQLDVDGRSAIYDWVAQGGNLPLGVCRNDLQPTVVNHWSEVGRRLESVIATEPLLAMLSGSGGTVFGLYPDEAAARRAAEALGPAGPMVAPLLTRQASRLRPTVMEE
jgi:4-diphosphocytidyl-2-C-methyl-D-erythritol kinase